VRDIDLVWIGCPHASLKEIEKVAELLAGRKTKAQLWVTTARDVLNAARAEGTADKIESCGGRVVADACLLGAPIHGLGFGSVATNSGKGAFYLLGHLGAQVRFGSLSRCVEAAISGRWQP